jgi:hypothetical protein
LIATNINSTPGRDIAPWDAGFIPGPRPEMRGAVNNSGGTSHTIAYQNVTPGSLLIAHVTANNTGSGYNLVFTPPGWTLLEHAEFLDPTGAVYFREAGQETSGSAAFKTLVSSAFSGYVLEVPNWDGVNLPVAGPAVFKGVFNWSLPDPAPVTATWGGPKMFIGTVGVSSGFPAFPPPEGYTTLAGSGASVPVMQVSAFRYGYNRTEDPPPFGWQFQTTLPWVSFSLAIPVEEASP